MLMNPLLPVLRLLRVAILAFVLLTGEWLAVTIAVPAGSLASAAEPAGPPTASDRSYGKEQVVVYDLDAASIAKLRGFKADAIDPKRSPAENIAMAGTADWVAPVQKFAASRNPYVQVITLTATALADGDAVSAWEAGWRSADGMTRSSPVAGLNKLKARAGERFVVTVASPPVSFKEDRSLQLVLGLVRTRNLQIDAVNVQVWSGLTGPTPMQVFFSLPMLFLGITMFALWWFLRNRV